MIIIIDYGIGNLKSVLNAFLHLGYQAKITSQSAEILQADKIVLPGVGAFADAIEAIKRKGLDETIKEIIKLQKPLLGICVGMQILFEKSYEYGVHDGLGVLKGEIVPFSKVTQEGKKLKIPHVGWNNLETNSKLFKNLNNPYVYFVHSYYLKTTENYIFSYTNYGEKIIASVENNNIYATQFHPEKSGEVGLQILRNFGDL